MKISTVIPVYKNKDLFLSYFRTNYKYINKTEIVIVDDGSGEDIEKDINKNYPNIKVIVNRQNLGFAKSVNRGIEAAGGKYILLLNSDVLLFSRSYEKGVMYLQKNPDCFAVGFLQIEKDGGCVGKNRIYFYKGIFQHSKADGVSPGLNAWAEGGAAIIRKRHIKLLNGFDSIYSPVYWEDVDLSYRAYKRGWNVYFDPHIKARHYHESTTKKYYKKTFIQTIAHRNQFIFIWKNITDRKLMIQHILFLPVHIFNNLVDLNTTFFIGLVKAVVLLPRILIKRRLEEKKQVKEDREVLQLFENKQKSV